MLLLSAGFDVQIKRNKDKKGYSVKVNGKRAMRLRHATSRQVYKWIDPRDKQAYAIKLDAVNRHVTHPYVRQSSDEIVIYYTRIKAEDKQYFPQMVAGRVGNTVSYPARVCRCASRGGMFCGCPHPLPDGADVGFVMQPFYKFCKPDSREQAKIVEGLISRYRLRDLTVWYDKYDDDCEHISAGNWTTLPNGKPLIYDFGV